MALVVDAPTATASTAADLAVKAATASRAWLHELAVWRTRTRVVAVAEAGDRLAGGAVLEIRRPAARLGPRVANRRRPAEQLSSLDTLVREAWESAGASLAAAAVDVVTVSTARSGVAERGSSVAATREVANGTRAIRRRPAPRHEYARVHPASELRRARGRGPALEVRFARHQNDVAHALRHLFRVHSDRWGDRADETRRCATTRTLREWNAHGIARLAEGNSVPVGELADDRCVVAASLGLVEGTGALAPTRAVRPDAVVRQAAPAPILACAEALAASGAETIDLSYAGGERGGPNARIEIVPEAVAARSPRRQRALERARQIWRSRRARR